MTTETHILLKDGNGKTIFSSLNPACIPCAEKCLVENEITTACGGGGKRRRGHQKSPVGSWFLCTNDPDSLNSTRKFKRELNNLAILLETTSKAAHEIEQKYAAETKRLAHNVEKLNAHILQEIYALVPQDSLARCGAKRKQVELITEKIEAVKTDVAEGILRVLKNATGIKSEFSVFSKLKGRGFPLDFRKHEIHRVVLNATSTFFGDFNERGITIEISPCQELVRVDYESCLVGLHHVLDNAVKYCRANTNIEVSFVKTAEAIVVNLKMISLHVPLEERERLHDEGFSSAGAKKLGSAGDGLGLYLSLSLFEINHGGLEMVFGNPMPTNIRGVEYSENVVKVTLPRPAK